MTLRFLTRPELVQVQKKLFSPAVYEQMVIHEERELLPQDFLLDHARSAIRILDHFENRLEVNSPERVVHFGLVLDGDVPLDKYLRVEDRVVGALLGFWKSDGNCVIETGLAYVPQDKFKSAGCYLTSTQVSRLDKLLRSLQSNPDSTFKVADPVDLELIVRLSIREVTWSALAFEELGLGFISHFDMKWLIWTRDARAQQVLEQGTQDAGVYWRYPVD